MSGEKNGLVLLPIGPRCKPRSARSALDDGTPVIFNVYVFTDPSCEVTLVAILLIPTNKGTDHETGPDAHVLPLADIVAFGSLVWAVIVTDVSAAFVSSTNPASAIEIDSGANKHILREGFI